MIYDGYLPSGQVSLAEGSKREAATAPLSLGAAFYIDGFNLYHAIDALGDNSLKWLNLRSLCESYLRPNNTISRIVFFTAINTWDAGKRERHLRYVKALESVGVEVARGTFDKPQKFCSHRALWCRNYGEKKTDVGIAVNLIGDGYEDKYAIAYLVSADSDHVPLVQRFNSSLPGKKLFVIAPPGRLSQARELIQSNGRRSFQLTAGRIRQHLFMQNIRDQYNNLIVARPALYAG